VINTLSWFIMFLILVLVTLLFFYFKLFAFAKDSSSSFREAREVQEQLRELNKEIFLQNRQLIEINRDMVNEYQVALEVMRKIKVLLANLKEEEDE